MSLEAPAPAAMRLPRWALPAVVFLTGMSVLVMEVLATRVLSPFYGNTIFTVSSVISVILLALSAGYYAGGRLADRRPSPRDFFALIMVSGVALLVLHVLGARLLPRLGDALSLETGPLVAASLLFLLPALLLGTVSPYAVKLQSLAAPAHGVGSTAGSIFFWSTLGSIAGSLLAGFVLIPTVGIDRTLLATGGLLFLLGAAPWLWLSAPRRRAVPPIVVGLTIAAATPWLAGGEAGADAIYVKDGVYQKITIYEGEYYGRPARFLLLDRSESGAMFLDSTDPRDLVYDYTKYYALHRVFTPRVRRALVLGGGAYSIPKALIAELPDVEVDVAEIEPWFYDLARQHFGLVSSPRLRNHVEDGRRFLQESPGGYDLIFGDVYYSYFSVPPHFTTREFFALARRRLAPGGVFIANMIGDLSRRQPSLVMAEIRTFREVFPNSRFFAVEALEQTKLVQNITLVGVNGTHVPDLAAPPVSTDPDPIVRFLRNREIDVDARYELSAYPRLTDDYAPVEYLTSQVLRRSLGQSFDLDGEEVLALADQQARYGDRRPGMPGHARLQRLVRAELGAIVQELVEMPVPAADGPALANVVGRMFASEPRRVVVAARGDAAAPVALLVELARGMLTSPEPLPVGVDFVTFDGSTADGRSRGAAEFARRVSTLYDSTPPVAVLLLDGPCRAGFNPQASALPLSALDGVLPRTDDQGCTGAGLERAGASVLSYLRRLR